MEYTVNVYIETTARGPAVRDGAFGYLIETTNKIGEPVTRQGFFAEKQTTESLMELEALTMAINRLTKPCQIRVFTHCEHILNAYGNHWIIQWKKNDWKNAKGKPVKNREAWEKLLKAAEPHAISFAGRDEKNQYALWMQDQLKGWKEKSNGSGKGKGSQKEAAGNHT